MPDAIADFAKRVAIVATGAHGLGEAIAGALASKCAEVRISDRDEPEPAGPRLGFHRVDIADAAPICRMVQVLGDAPVVPTANLIRVEFVRRIPETGW